MTRLLLDTHIWLWGLLEPERLRPRVVADLSNSSNELWLSPISIWEFFVLHRKKRLALIADANAWVADRLAVAPLKEAPVTIEVARELGRLQLPHGDPADHFLVATAKVFELTLVTADERLLRLRDIPLLPNR
ncbi:MAG TPA: type II toxin-antitoxin system VapC family toxin [Terriglobales bacterium]|nr:type II toxin-antitoxin system VapC family toxin [Terriglobales bacterium]